MNKPILYKQIPNASENLLHVSDFKGRKYCHGEDDIMLIAPCCNKKVFASNTLFQYSDTLAILCPHCGCQGRFAFAQKIK